jgi:uncharacterized protein with PQ loop repeat
MIIEVLAWSGALLSSLLSVPQLLRALRSERLDGISATTYWLVLGNALVWAVWAVLAEEYAAGVPALVNGPAAILIIIRLHLASPSSAGSTVAASVEPTADDVPLEWRSHSRSNCQAAG